MIRLPKKAKVFLIFAIVITFITVGVNVGTVVLLSGNIAGAADIYTKYLVGRGYDLALATDEIGFMCIQGGLLAVMNLLYGISYVKYLRKGFNRNYRGAFMATFPHMLLGSLIGGLFALIGLKTIESTLIMARPKTEAEKEKFVNDYKMEAMKEAVTRLKELKAKGAISEEEYFDALNKILES